ncbi:Pentatricopeptide repeat-containing protein [Cynara cardunculus var. scolymus]|uniref:Pentatricopeptide repeat-containing protein n=1 Tax=Cynara cardunculus var. scolymus TaxID=59895 RepID=A0A103XEZ8_CYNCS|nr:Pentatricopeptide repeat-containing protein [Cynara cardunculus var. scolymus]
MKLSRLTLRIQGVCRNASKNLFSSSSSSLSSSSLSSKLLTSQTPSSEVTERKKENLSRRSPTFPTKNEPNSSLYRRISPVGDPDISIIPVLDQWVSEGREVDKESLINIIASLKKYKRFKHALEWMTNKRYIPPMKDDIKSRLPLIYKVHGLEKAEEFYNNISQIFKGYEVDTTLLYIYSLEKSVDKAEAVMQKLRKTGCPMTAFPYNILLNLYYHIRDWAKMDALTKEMAKNGIYGDRHSFTPLLNAYAANSDIEGLNRTMAIMEADPRVCMDCKTYIFAANAFLKTGLVEKCLKLMKDAEMAITVKDRYKSLNTLLRMYTDLGKKDEVYRIWKRLAEKKIYNTGYRRMINSLLRFDDVEGAERVFEEWETKGLSYDFVILDELIDVYVKTGNLGKAEILLKHGIEKGGNPTFRTWYCLTIGYIEDNQVVKGFEALKNATFSCRFLPFQEPVKDKLAIVLECLESRRNMEEVAGFMKSLEAEGIFSSTVCGRLLDFIVNETSKS